MEEQACDLPGSRRGRYNHLLGRLPGQATDQSADQPLLSRCVSAIISVGMTRFHTPLLPILVGVGAIALLRR